MRINHAPSFAPQYRRTESSPRAQANAGALFSRDSFDRRATSAQASTALPAGVEKSMAPLIEQLVRGILQKLMQLLGGAQPGATQPGQVLPGAVQPGGPAGAGGLAPTPLAGEVPGQVSEVNTPENKNIARPSQFRDAVNGAIDRVRAKAVGIDPNDRDRITDFNAYHQAVVLELRQAGYNAAHDGEELSVGRPGDNFNEQFDISTWKGEVRRFYASWVSPPVWAQQGAPG